MSPQQKPVKLEADKSALESRFLGIELARPVNLTEFSRRLDKLGLKSPFENQEEPDESGEVEPDQLDYSTWKRFLNNSFLLMRSSEKLRKNDPQIATLAHMDGVRRVGRLSLALQPPQPLQLVFDEQVVWFKGGVPVEHQRIFFRHNVQVLASSRHFPGKYVVSGDVERIPQNLLRFPAEQIVGDALDDIPRPARATLGLRRLTAPADASDPNWHLKDIRALEALSWVQERVQRASPPMVAVIDRGFDVSLRFLLEKRPPGPSGLPGYENDHVGWNFLRGCPCLADICLDGERECVNTRADRFGHAHAVASLAAGVSPKSRLLLLVQPNNEFDLGEALGYARDRQAGVLVGTETKIGRESQESGHRTVSNHLRESFRILEEAGVAAFYSSGNDASRNSVPFPAGLETVEAVGASTGREIWCYSNRTSATPRLWAPSGPSKPEDFPLERALLAAGHDGLPAAFGGTSGAAPILAGAAALVLTVKPTLAPRQVRNLLFESGVRLNDNCAAGNPDYRRVDVLEAVQLASRA